MTITPLKTLLRHAVWVAVLAIPGAQTFADEAPYERDFGYAPLEIYEFADGTSRLRISDINRDGRDDIVFANNIESRLEILLRKDVERADFAELPVLEETFDNVGFVIDDAVSDCRADDIDADGKPDIVTLGTTFGIEIRWQNGRDTFEAPKRLMVRDASAAFAFQTSDLDSNDANDILVSRRDGAEILWNDGQRGFTERTQLSFAESRCRHISTDDVNNDGQPDLLFFFPGSDLPLRVRLNEGKRRFGPEHPLPMPAGRHYQSLPHVGASTAIGCLLQNGKVFRLYDIEESAQTSGLASDAEAIPLRIPLEGTDPKAQAAWAVRDVDQDGFEDLCVAAPALSQIHIYRGSSSGLGATPIVLDSLTGISAIAFNTQGDLAVLSPTEKILAIHRHHSFTKAFPEIVALDDPPLAMGFAEDGKTLYCSTRDNRTHALVTIDVATGTARNEQPLDMRNDPYAIMAIPLSPQTNGLVFFKSYQPPQMFLASSNTLEALPVAKFRALTENLTPAAFSRVPGDGPTQVVVANKHVGRLYAWRDGEFQIVQQFNPGIAGAELGGVVMPRSADRTHFYESKQGRILSFNDQGKLSVSAKLRGTIAGFNAITTLSRPQTEPTILLIGQKEVHLFPSDVKRLSLSPLAEYATDVDEPSLRYFRQITTGANAVPMVSIVDGANRALEILTMHDDHLVRALTFEVFSITAFSGNTPGAGRSEPHAVVSGDLNGDGISDLVCLVHDKLIIYPGE